jgi:hypothetical protein
MKKILNSFTQIVFGYKQAEMNEYSNMQNNYVLRIKNAQEKLLHIKGNKN